MGAPIAAFLTLVLSLLLLRRLVFRPVVPGMDANLLDGAAIAALNRDRKQQLEQRRTTEAAKELVALPSTPQQAREHLKWLEQLSRGSAAERLQAMQEAQRWGIAAVCRCCAAVSVMPPMPSLVRPLVLWKRFGVNPLAVTAVPRPLVRARPRCLATWRGCGRSGALGFRDTCASSLPPAVRSRTVEPR